jgi:hypothetical protein
MECEENFAENDAFTLPPRLKIRVETERNVLSYAKKGVRAMVVRPPLSGVMEGAGKSLGYSKGSQRQAARFLSARD